MTSSRIASIAGQPEYVGVTTTSTAPPGETVTSRRTPRSSIVSTGTSGSGTAPASARARSTSVGVGALTAGSPGRPGVRAVQVLQLGEQEPHRGGVDALPTALGGPSLLRLGEAGLAEHRPDVGQRRAAQRRRVDGDTLGHERRVGPDAVSG